MSAGAPPDAVVPIRAVLVGRAVPFGPPGRRSAIRKGPAKPGGGPVAVTPTGLAGDEQGDPKHHGGPEKAVHHYPFDHYAFWRGEDGPDGGPLAAPGAFGENLSTLGLTESAVRVGDVFRAGTALLQVSQARQPCWKLNVRFGFAGMARRVQETGRTGWYYRVLEPGELRAGDALRLVDRPHPDWPIARLHHHLYVDRLDRAALEWIADLPALTQSWRELARRRLTTGRVEDWSRRLGEGGPPAPPRARDAPERRGE